MKTLVIKRNGIQSKFQIEDNAIVRLSAPNGIYVVIENYNETIAMIYADEWYLESELKPIVPISFWERIRNW